MSAVNERMEGAGIENKVGDVKPRLFRYATNIPPWWSDA